MKLSPIIAQLKTSTTRFNSNIGGAAHLMAAQTETYSVDRAFVVQLAETATPNDQDVGLNQTITNTFAVMVALDNRIDKRGQAAHDELATTRTQLFSSILNWSPPGSSRPIQFVGSRYLNMNRAFFWYQFEFSVEACLTEADGYQPTFDDLTHVSVKYDMVDETEQTDAEDDIFPNA